MTLSKEQKERAIADLSHPWGRVSLRCDGYLVTLVMQRTGKNSLTFRVTTFVNGRIEGAWFVESSAAQESRFMRKSIRPNLSAAKRKAAEKALGKRYVARDPFYSGSYTLYLPDWVNGKAAINHLCKVCESIELLSVDEARVALNALAKPVAAEPVVDALTEG
ncbi:hypothetical protein B0920_02165 [Massilia sp. KIM]|uniref:hypothetical protein n=1 Tax=Massilia sp. KIM TaxID=1955422 RepID=UPI00098EB5B4|nr:hypothetical protein [Massilia sp. KIM]OON62305.1 hypothetical protein B0920_02165 [Massilia sp. KIM]